MPNDKVIHIDGNADADSVQAAIIEALRPIVEPVLGDGPKPAAKETKPARTPKSSGKNVKA